MTLAGSAVAYVVKLYLEAGERRRDNFFELMRMIDTSGTIAAKVTAVYQLRSFPDHRDFIIRFCTLQQPNVTGEGAAPRIAEMQATAEYFRSS
jgi:hypothetical protein